MREHPGASGFAALTLIMVAGTVYLTDRATGVKADEQALARARPCASQVAGDRDCVEDVAGAAVGPLRVAARGTVAKLKVSYGGTQSPLTFPRGVRPVFEQIQDGDFVALRTWHGAIVSATAQSDTETTSNAPSERYRSQLTGAFVAAAFTVLLAGITVLGAVLTDLIFGYSRRWLGYGIAGVVIFGGFGTAGSAAVISEGGSVGAALLTAPIVVAAGVVIVGGGYLWNLLKRRRETERFMRRRTAG
ncbi:hypothetical protein [Catenulispora pinisilvae]|uniref:hypothetical protein n=1 Tax=Catenulispora pinisilvae TaxID=2705253 RepID=UPI0018917881|nr:hypothetical protein [Catenulispora pinisilvae]